MPRPDLSQFELIYFDHQEVEKQFEAYCNEHPDADDLTKQQITHQLVATEAVIWARVKVLDNESKLTDVKKKYQEIRDKVKNGSDKVQEFFAGYMADDCVDLLYAFQNHAIKSSNYRKFYVDSIYRYEPLSMANGKRIKERQQTEGVSFIFDKAFFNPKTDRNALSYTLNTKEANEQCEKWQDEIDAVDIPVQNGMDEDLIAIAVLGETLKDENLVKAYDTLNKGGSTLLGAVDTANTVKMSFFNNMSNYDDRMNMQAIRSIIPTARENVKRYIEDDNKDAIKQCLSKAAKEVYYQLAITASTSSIMSYAAPKMMQIMQVAERNNISLTDLGFTEKQIENVNNNLIRYKLKTELFKIQDEFDKHITGFTLSDGKDPNHDIIKNKELHEKLIDAMAYQSMLKEINKEIDTERRTARIAYLNNDEKMAEREPGLVERSLREKPYATFQYFRNFVKNSPQYKELLKANISQKHNLLCNVSLVDTPSFYKNNLTFGDWKTYETKIADEAFQLHLASTNDLIKLAAKKMSDPDVTNLDKAIYHSIHTIKSAIEVIIDKRNEDRAKGIDFASEDHAREMAKRYKELSNRVASYHDLDPTADWLGEASMSYYQTMLSFDELDKQFAVMDQYKELETSLKGFVAKVESSSTLYGVFAQSVDELKWGVTKDQHVAHFFDGPSDDMIEIDPDEPVENTITGIDQKAAYNTASDKKTMESFKALVKLSATEYERDGIDKDYKNILRGIKAYVTAARRSTQQSALVDLNAKIKAYEKKYHGKENLAPAITQSLDSLDDIKIKLGEINNGTLVVDPGAKQIRSNKEPTDAGLGHLGFWRKTESPLFPHEPSPNDIKQGVINDCFMLSALTKIARDNPQQIKDSIKDNNNGTVTVRFFDVKYKDGQKYKEPVYVTVNKTINQAINGANLYSSSSTWVQMIEKAYAQYIDSGSAEYVGDQTLHGFQRLDRGFTSQFMNNFDPEVFYENNKESFGFEGGYEKELYNLNAPKRNEYTEDEKDLFEFFSRVNTGEVMTVGGTTDNKDRQKYMKNHGIRPNHAYTVMQTFEKEVNGQMKKFVQLRDPFATYEAKYNDKNELVDNSAFIGNSLKAGSNNMGTFNLEFTDFLKMYNSIPGMTREASDQFRALDNLFFNRKKEKEAALKQQAKEEKLVDDANQKNVADEFEVVNDNQKNVADEFEIVNEQPKNVADEFEIVNEQPKNVADDFEVVNEKPKNVANDFEIVNEKPKNVADDFEVVNKQPENIANDFEVVEQPKQEKLVREDAPKNVPAPEKKRESPKVRAALDYLNKLENVTKNAIIEGHHQTSDGYVRTDYEKSLATLLTCYTIKDVLKRVGKQMDENMKLNLLDKNTLKSSVKDMYNSKAYKELYESLREEDIRGIALDESGQGIEKAYTKLKQNMNKAIEKKAEEAQKEKVEEPKKEKEEMSLGGR